MFTGLTRNTAKHLQLDAGVFVKNYDIETDTWATARATKIIGATAGGGSFTAIPTIRQVEVDGTPGDVVGLDRVDRWDVNMTTTFKEMTAETVKTALGPVLTEAAESPEGYTKITGKMDVEEADYIENVTWIGRISGTREPVIIVLKNAISTGGFTLNMQDKNEGTIPVTLRGSFDVDALDKPPFDIYYPTVE